MGADWASKRYSARNAVSFSTLSTSDLDLLVRPRSRKSFAPIDLALDLSRLLGRHVDGVSERSLHWLVEPQVVAEAVPL
jgi:predicted nucleotidyltransferase